MTTNQRNSEENKMRRLYYEVGFVLSLVCIVALAILLIIFPGPVLALFGAVSFVSAGVS